MKNKKTPETNLAASRQKAEGVLKQKQPIPDFELYDFAPTSYFTLTQVGEIIRLNIRGAAMLGKESCLLKNSLFGLFVSADTKPIFDIFLDQVFNCTATITCEVVLLANDNLPINVHLSGIINKKRKTCLVTAVDITEHKKVENMLIMANNALVEREKELQDKYAVLNSIFESPQNIIIFSLDTNYCYKAFTDCHKQTMKKIWGVDIKIGMNMLEVILDQADCKKAKDNFDKTLKGEYLRFEEEYGDPRLHRTYYENIYNPIIDSNGNISGLSVFVIDITDRKHAEEDLLKSERKLETMLQTMIDGMVTVNMAGEITYCNAAAEQILDMSKNVLGKYFQSHEWNQIDEHGNPYPPEQLPLAIALREQRSVANVEHALVSPTGEWKWISVNAAPLFDGNGQLTGGIASFRDITKRKVAEQALAQSRAELKAIYDHSPVMMCVVDSKRRVQFANPAFTSLTSSSEESLKGGHACGVFGCINALCDIRGCGFGKNCRSCNLLFAIEDTLKNGTEHYNVEYNATILKNGSAREMSFLGSTSLIQSADQRNLLLCLQDITTRKQAEEVIRKSEERYRSLLMNLEAGIVVHASDTSIIMNNPRAAELLGLSNDLMKGKPAIDPDWKFVKADKTPLLLEDYPVNQILTGKKPIKNQLLGIHQPVTNDIVWVMVNGFPTFDNMGGINEIVISFIDVTDRKILEDAQTFLLQSGYPGSNENFFESLARYLSQSLSMEYVCIDRLEGDGLTAQTLAIFNDGKFDTNVSYTLKETPCGEVVEKTICCFPDDVCRLFPNDAALQDLKAVSYIGTTLRSFDGKPIGLIAVIGRKPMKNPILAEALLKQVAVRAAGELERKQTEESLTKTNAYLENLINYANAPIIVWDPQFRITRFNHAFEFITGLIEKEVLGHSLKILFPKALSENSMKLIRNTLTGERWEIVEIQIQHKDNSVRTVLWNSATLFTADGKTPIATIAQGQDITERKQAEESLRETNVYLESATSKANEMAAQAEAANKAKSIFLANMSHEIRTPLNAIIGFSQLLNRDKALSPTQKEYVISIINAGEHLLSLINDILELSKIEAGRVVLSPTNIDLFVFLSNIQMIFKERTQSKHLQFIFENDEDLPRFVLVDESKLRQIFINLIGNALKFTDEGGIAVRTKVYKIKENLHHLVVEIQDSGPGITEIEQKNLFKHFVQTSSGIKKGSGTGLGLALCHELTNLMGGRISVSSEVGKGSVFTFYVEIKEGEITEPESRRTKVVKIDNGEKHYRILVVDDKEENLRVAVNLLKLVGFETNEAVNGVDAIVKFEEYFPDLILMDLRMPVMDGYEATKRIKSTDKGITTPIIALTASAFEEEQEKTKLFEFKGYIRKPFRENDLFSTIGKILDIKYIYEDEKPLPEEKNINADDLMKDGIGKLPNSLIIEMLQAASVANVYQLKKLVQTIETDDPELAHRLMTFVRNFDYNQLQKILNIKGLEL